MKLKDKVVSPELAQKMAKLGWVYETERYWCRFLIPTYTLWDIRGEGFVENYRISKRKLEYISAPDAIEIGEKLPEGSCIIRDKRIKNIEFGVGFYNGKYKGQKIKMTFSNTEAEARGKMWCYLKERKLI